MKNLDELYETVFLELRNYLENKSLYKPVITKITPEDVNKVSDLALVSCTKGSYKNPNNMLKKAEEIYDCNIMIINIFTQADAGECCPMSAILMCKELRIHIENFFKRKVQADVYVSPDFNYVTKDIFRCVIFINYKILRD